MANQILTRQEITRESLMILQNDLKAVPNFYRDLEQEFGQKGKKIGDTIFVRKPVRAIGRDGQAYAPEALIDTEVPITINQQSGSDFEFSTAEKYLSIDEFKSRYLKQHMLAIANKLDYRALQMAMVNTGNLVGTVGTTPGLSGSDSFLTYSQAGQKLVEMGFKDRDQRVLCISAAMETGWNTYSKAFFNPQDILGKQWKTGQISNALSNTWYVDENVPAQTLGLFGGTPTVNGAGQTGTSIITQAWSNSITGVVQLGDSITFGSVFAVNPQSRASTGSLMQFAVQAAANSSGAGAATLTIYPGIVPSGPFQNVTASPANGALISVYGVAAAGQSALSGVTSRQGILWTKQAFAFVSFPGDVPENADMAFEDRSNKIGVSLRFVRMFDAARDMWPCRFDVYYGMGPLYPEGACRICGS